MAYSQISLLSVCNNLILFYQYYTCIYNYGSMIKQHCWLELMYDVTLLGVYSVSFIKWYAVSLDLGEILHG